MKHTAVALVIAMTLVGVWTLAVRAAPPLRVLSADFKDAALGAPQSGDASLAVIRARSQHPFRLERATRGSRRSTTVTRTDAPHSDAANVRQSRLAASRAQVRAPHLRFDPRTAARAPSLG